MLTYLIVKLYRIPNIATKADSSRYLPCSRHLPYLDGYVCVPIRHFKLLNQIDDQFPASGTEFPDKQEIHFQLLVLLPGLRFNERIILVEYIDSDRLYDRSFLLVFRQTILRIDAIDSHLISHHRALWQEHPAARFGTLIEY